MAEDTQDRSSQTEEPTEKKLQDAIQKGNTPQSREVGTFMSVIAAVIVVAGLGPTAFAEIAGAMVPLVDRPEDLLAQTSVQDLMHLLSAFAGDCFLALLPIFGVLVVCGLVGAFVQGNVVIAPDRIEPKLERISLTKGFGRVFGLAALVNFGTGLLKLSIVAIVTGVILWPAFAQAEAGVHMDVAAIPELMKDLTLRMLLAVAGAMTLIVAVDLLWRRFDWRRGLRMSTKEIKDELKQVEGDPHVKAKLREIRRERARRRMMEAVPQASVVIVNPTHFAVALKYDRTVDAAPVCVAKGLDLIALKIREVAEQNGVPVAEDPPLARALHAAVEIDQPISPDFYRAVARIITYVMTQDAEAAGKAPAAEHIAADGSL